MFSKLNLNSSYCFSNATSLADTYKYVHAVGGSMKGVLCEVNETHEALYDSGVVPMNTIDYATKMQ